MDNEFNGKSHDEKKKRIKVLRVTKRRIHDKEIQMRRRAAD